MRRFLFLRFFTHLLILSFGLGSPPAYDRGNQELVAGNGAASDSRSHALRPMSDESGLEEKLHSASGLEEAGRSRQEGDGVETPGRERGESSFFRKLEMDLPEE